MQEPTGHAAQRNDTVSSAFALVNAQDFLFEIDVVHSQVTKFLLADGGGVEDLKNGPIAIALVGVRIHRFENPPRFLYCEHLPRQVVGLTALLKPAAGSTDRKPPPLRKEKNPRIPVQIRF